MKLVKKLEISKELSEYHFELGPHKIVIVATALKTDPIHKFVYDVSFDGEKYAEKGFYTLSQAMHHISELLHERIEKFRKEIEDE